MSIFRRRRLSFRRSPRILSPGRRTVQVAGASLVVLALGLGWQAAEHLNPAASRPAARPQVHAVVQAAAPAAPPKPETIPLQVRPGETLARAVERAGVPREEAEHAVDLLAQAMDTVHIKAGMALQAAIARPGDGQEAQLVSLSLHDGPAHTLRLSRTFDGALKLREMEEKIRGETVAADGSIEDSLYESAEKLGASPQITAEVVKLFAHKLDFQRDIQPGDDFKLVFDRKVTESGKLVESGDLQYAELHGVKFYRFERPHGDVEYFDETGKNIKGFLLRTPVDGAHITSLFGMRKHPILGYTRAHQGIDFGAPTGTPIYAAGDGVVVEAGRKGGYGNWVRIHHTGAWDTAYGHISRFAPGIHPGVHVRQGQVIAYVGATGLATGPHLHYEIWEHGARVNPLSAKVPQGTVLAGRELARFKAVKAHIDGLLAAQAKRRGDSPALAQANVGQPLQE
jgi:murein DD-endopeptidase MepM/ murein hydrolase activator NlpD